MQQVLNNPYTTYALTAQEEEDGQILNPLLKAVIQNRRMEIIAQKLGLKAEMSEEGQRNYWQLEAYLRGQLDILTHLLEASDAIESNHN